MIFFKVTSVESVDVKGPQKGHYFILVSAREVSSISIKNVYFNGWNIPRKNFVNYAVIDFHSLQVSDAIEFWLVAFWRVFFSFLYFAVYSPDMPKRLPLSIIFSGFLGTVAHAVRFWLHYTLVALAWLGVVPLTACRIYRTLFTGSVSSILSLPINVFST